ncbi:mucin-12-like [Ostrinia nubilalis]|uniref:mucin-12-like n=1 Tax=Ostrinia nubilalis TaxID=29057 RepID=UPI0030826542
MVPTYIFAVLIFVSCVLCENCVIYNFEDDLANNFTSHEVCNQQPWERKLYPSGEVNSPHIKSTAFITPSTVLSCMTSSLFAMHKDGVFEFNVYTSLTLDTDFVKVIVYQKEIDGPDTIVGISETNLVAGSYKNSDWTTLKVKLLGSESFNGYFTIFGRASMDSLIVMDALKYESPFLANEICEIYAHDDADPDSGSTENYPGSSDSNESTVGTVSTESYPGSSDSNESTVGTVSTESYPGSSDSNESTVGTVSTESYPGSSDSNESTVGTVSTESYPGSSDSNESTVGTVSTESYPGSSDSNESTVGTVSTESYPGSSDSNESTVGTGSTESYPSSSDSNESTVGTVSTESYPGSSDSNESTVGTVSTESYPGSSDSNESTVGTVSTESYPGSSDSNESTVGTVSTESYPGSSDSNESTVGTVSTESYPDSSDSYESTVGTVSTESYPGTSDSNESTVGTGSTESYPGSSDSNESTVGTGSTESYPGSSDSNESTVGTGSTESYPGSSDSNESTVGTGSTESYPGSSDSNESTVGTVSTESYPGTSDSNESTVGTVSTESYPGTSDSNESTVGTVSTESYPGTSDSNESTVGTGSTESYPGTSDSNETDPDSESNENPGAGCVTYQFGQDFNSLFSNDGVCRYSANWLLRNYTSLTIDSPHKNSVLCIIPGNGWSCTSSFTFPMSAGGILEVEVYLEPFSATDRVLVTVYQINSLGTDLVVGSAASDRQFGWSTLRIQLAGDGDYDGQVTIMGQVAVRSLVIVDSFRYIPPTVDESLCIVYDETPVISPTTEANEASTTPEVEEPDSEEDGCVTYQFGQDYNTLFSSDGVCRYSTNWLLRNYSMLAIDSPHEDSFSCIIPGNGWSCTSSFIFPMSAGGILEMKVYLQPFLAADRVLVTVYQINSLGTDLVVGSAGTDRQFGWSTLRIQLAGDGDFDGQITIMGQVAIRSVVLVDSFRYIPPSSNEENCKIYN